MKYLKKDQMFCKATLSMLSPFDYETNKYQNISLVATDMTGEKEFLNISLEVLDTNDPPTVSDKNLTKIKK
jgi:hypothetical protein